MNRLNYSEKNLVNLVKEYLNNKNFDFKKKKDVIKIYENINKLIVSNDYSPYDINNIIFNHKQLKLSKFLKTLAEQYNKILYKSLNNFNFKDDLILKDFCKRCKIRGYKKVKKNILEFADNKLSTWEGMWSICDYKKAQVCKIKLIDPELLNKIV